MEARGLATRRRWPADRRVVTARPTEPGRRAVDALDGPVQEPHARQPGHLSDEELGSLIALLERARDA